MSKVLVRPASGEENHRCSECGYVARKARTLRKTRRHWRWAMVGMVLVAGAVTSAATPKVQRDGAWALAPNTLLILMAPDGHDAFVATPMKDEALRRLVEDRLGIVYSNSQLPENGLWDWQWGMLVPKATRYVSEMAGSWSDPAYRAHSRSLTEAVGNGIVHRIGLDREVARIRTSANASRLNLFGSHRRKSGQHKFFSDQPVGFGLYKGGPFAAAIDTKDITITIGDDLEPLRWKRTERPYPLGCFSGETNWLGVLYLPDSLSDGQHEITFRLHECVDYPYATLDVPDDLFVAEYTLTYQFDTAGSYHDFIQPDFDPRLDDRVRRNVQFELEATRQTVHVHINPYWMKLKSWIGRIWRLELLKDCVVVGSASRMLREHDAVHFQALPVFPEIFEGNIEGDWMLRFQIDPEAMILWNMPSDYWAGVIEVPIDCEYEMNRLRSAK